MAVLFIGEPIEVVQVVNRIGQYIFLANGLRFHFLDDKVGERTWKLENALIQWP
ncbi:MAG: hypothetical protein ACK45I_04000 [Bacteroidota bacterium]